MKISALPLLDPALMDGTEGLPIVKGLETYRSTPGNVVDASFGPLASALAAALGNYRSTLAAGVTDFAVGQMFTSDETGTLYIYKRIAAAPGYQLYSRVLTQAYADRLKSKGLTPTVDLGAVGDGASAAADQAGFAAMMAAIVASTAPTTGTLDYAEYTNGGQIEPGIYDAGNLIYTPAAIRLVARIPGTVVIRIPAGQYFLNLAGKMNGIILDGITFVGGKGVLNLTNTGNNVALLQSITRCFAYNYTECAFQNNANDSPYLRFNDNVLFGAPGVKTIGVAWGGYADQGEIKGNAFLQNAYHVKIGPRISSSMMIWHNDFISWGDPVNKTLSDVWEVPNSDAGSYGSNSGYGASICFNKFGLENQNVAAPRLLIANEDQTTGTNRGTYMPSSTDSPTGYLSQLIFENNVISGSDGITAPVIQCNISNLRGLSWRANKFNGSPYASIINFPNGRAPDYTTSDNLFVFEAGDATAGGYPARAFSNVVVGQLRDFGGFFPGDPNAVDVWPVSDGADATLLVSAQQPGAFGLFGGSVLADRVLDSDGGTDWALITSGGNGAGTAISIAPPAAGGLAWIEGLIGKAATRTVTTVRIDVVNFTTGIVALRRDVTLPATVSRWVQPVQIPASTSPTSWQVRIYPVSGVVSGTTDQFALGWFTISMGPARLGRRRTLDKLPQLPVNRNFAGAVAGAPGTLPQGWSLTAIAGINTAVVKRGTDKRGAFTDLRIYGSSTTGVTSSMYLRYEPDGANEYTGSEAARWRHYVPITLIAGSLAGLVSLVSAGEGRVGGTSGPVRIGFIAYNSTPTYSFETEYGYTPTSTYGVYGKPDFNLQNSGAASLTPVILLQITPATAIDCTLRIYAPDVRRMS